MSRSLIRLTALAFALTAALWITSVSAQQASWLRTYPERHADGCDWVVAAWSDASFTLVPWNCPAGVTPRRPNTVIGWNRSYPQLEAGSNCVSYVVLWQDGVYTKVPFTCPGGITLNKDFTFRGTPQPTPVPVPAVTPTPVLQYPNAFVTGVVANCGVTDFRGRIEDAAGNGIDGVAIRIRTTDGQWEALSNLSSGGNWDLVVAPSARAGEWQLWVDINGTRQSPVINARTDGPERCGPGSGGVQSVFITFRR